MFVGTLTGVGGGLLRDMMAGVPPYIFVKHIYACAERYAEQDTWKEDLIFEEDSFTLLQNILEEAGELDERVPYADLVDTTFAQKAAP